MYISSCAFSPLSFVCVLHFYCSRTLALSLSSLFRLCFDSIQQFTFQFRCVCARLCAEWILPNEMRNGKKSDKTKWLGVDGYVHVHCTVELQLQHSIAESTNDKSNTIIGYLSLWPSSGAEVCVCLQWPFAIAFVVHTHKKCLIENVVSLLMIARAK